MQSSKIYLLQGPVCIIYYIHIHNMHSKNVNNCHLINLILYAIVMAMTKFNIFYANYKESKAKQKSQKTLPCYKLL